VGTDEDVVGVEGGGEYTGGDEVGVLTACEYEVEVEGGIDESPSSQSSPSSAVEKQLRS
jgi:hypothetical protein